MAGQRPSDAFLFAAAFHEQRAPKLMRATVDRRQVCFEATRRLAPPPTPKKLKGGVKTMLEGLERRGKEGGAGRGLHGNLTEKLKKFGRGGRSLLSRGGEGGGHSSIRCAQLQV